MAYHGCQRSGDVAVRRQASERSRNGRTAADRNPSPEAVALGVSRQAAQKRYGPLAAELEQ